MSPTESSQDGPHQNQPVKHAGAPLRVADAAVVLLHGRGATAESILELADEFHVHGVAAIAPQAQYNRWYPQSFMAPLDANEPELSSALAAVDDVLDTVVEAGIPRERIVLLGFSQGACLATEYVARNPRRYGGLVALSGGLIGPQGMDFEHTGSRAETPAFFGCSDVDPHIPKERVEESAAVFERLDGDVTTRLYEGMAHTINGDEVAWVEALLTRLVEDGGDER